MPEHQSAIEQCPQHFYEMVRDYLIEDTVVKIAGFTNQRDGAISVFGQDMAILDVSSVVAGQEPPVVLVTSLERITPEFVDTMKAVLLSHPGRAPVHLRLRSNAGRETLMSLSNVRVTNDVPFRSEIKVLLGAGGIE